MRIKTERGRGGGAEDILYENLHGVTHGGIQLTSNYDPGLPRTNMSATPVIRRITIRNVTANTQVRKKTTRPYLFFIWSSLLLVQLSLCLSRACRIVHFIRMKTQRFFPGGCRVARAR